MKSSGPFYNPPPAPFRAKPKRHWQCGQWWECRHSGSWVAVNGNLYCFHMLAGTAESMWEVYVGDEADEMIDLIGQGQTMREAIDDAAHYAILEIAKTTLAVAKKEREKAI